MDPKSRTPGEPVRAAVQCAITFASLLLAAGLCGGCAVVAVADAAVAVTATVVKAGAAVIGGSVDVARAGVRAMTDSGDQKK